MVTSSSTAVAGASLTGHNGDSTPPPHARVSPRGPGEYHQSHPPASGASPSPVAPSAAARTQETRPNHTQPEASSPIPIHATMQQQAASLTVVERSGTSPPRDAFSAGMLEAIQAHATAVHTPGITEELVQSMSNMDWIVPRDELEVLAPISSGAQGDVYQGRLKSLDELVAIKKFPFLDQKSRDCFRQEVTMLSKFRHENIVMFKGAVMTPDMCCIISELCVDNLLNRLESPVSISWNTRLRWARDIAKSMNYLHLRVPPIVHRDLKSLNILVDQNGNVKLCDFGMARTKEHTYIATKHIAGSPSWMAPEVLRGDDFNEHSDVYSFGVILWELLVRKIPWADKTMAQLVGLVGFAGHRLEIPAVIPDGCPPNYVLLIKQCWAIAPDRPTFKQIRVLLDAMLADVD